MSRLATAHTLRPVLCPIQEAVDREAAFQAQLQQLAEELRLSAQEAESKQAVVTDLQDELAAARASNESRAANLQVRAM